MKLTDGELERWFEKIQARGLGPAEPLSLVDVLETLEEVVGRNPAVRTLPPPSPPPGLKGEAEEAFLVNSLTLALKTVPEALAMGLTATPVSPPTDEDVDGAIRAWMQKQYRRAEARAKLDAVDVLNALSKEIALASPPAGGEEYEIRLRLRRKDDSL